MGKLQNVDSKSQRPGNFELLFVVICVGCLDLLCCMLLALVEKNRQMVMPKMFFVFSGGGFS